MSKVFSLYLDFMRFSAAFLVLIFHANSIYNPGLRITTFGHEAVIIFFVLSGFVIAYVAEEKEDRIGVFLMARAARIYSVALAAILFTALLDFAGFSIYPEAYPQGYQAWDFPLIRVISSALFLNEIWFMGIQLFSNVPYWSMNYEVWYYIIFAVSFYITSHRKWPLLAAIFLLVGPKILLLMPIWWMGVFVYRKKAFMEMNKNQAWLLLVLSLLGFTVYITQNLGHLGWNFMLELLGPDWHKQLGWSRQFLTDYFLGFYLMIHFGALRYILVNASTVNLYIERPVRYLAGATFSLYLFHQPLLWFFSAVFSFVTTVQVKYGLAIVCAFTVALLLSEITERRKKPWLLAINSLVEAISSRLSRNRVNT